MYVDRSSTYVFFFYRNFPKKIFSWLGSLLNLRFGVKFELIDTISIPSISVSVNEYDLEEDGGKSDRSFLVS